MAEKSGKSRVVATKNAFDGGILLDAIAKLGNSSWKDKNRILDFISVVKESRFCSEYYKKSQSYFNENVNNFLEIVEVVMKAASNF